MKYLAVTGDPRRVAEILTRIVDGDYAIETPDGAPVMTAPTVTPSGTVVIFVAVKRSAPSTLLE